MNCRGSLVSQTHRMQDELAFRLFCTFYDSLRFKRTVVGSLPKLVICLDVVSSNNAVDNDEC